MNFIGPYSDFPGGFAPPMSRPGRHTEIRKIAPAAGFPISLGDIKDDLRVDSSDDDGTIMRMARAAAAFLEIRTACSVLAGRYEAHFSDWCYHAPWELNRWPLREVLEIAWLDCVSTSPSWTPVDLDQFFIETRSRNFLIIPHRSFNAPALNAPFSGIRVRFIAGFDVELTTGESGGEQVSESDAEPKPIEDGMRMLLQMLIAHYYENRELFLADKLAQVEAGAGSLLAGYRQFW